MDSVASSLEVQAIPVGRLFSESGRRYSVPIYQRNYTWGEEQIHRLIADILDEAESESHKDYFLGNLVVAHSGGADESLSVIDGQQRLTTLYILLRKLQSRTKLGHEIVLENPLTYEARDKATRALKHLFDANSLRPDDESREDSGIFRAAGIIDQLLDDPDIGARAVTEKFISYLLHQVLLIQMPVDSSTDLNRYFEIMNTRGAQLSPVDIVKARLLRHLDDPLDRQLLNRVWTACSDMDHYVAMGLTPKDPQLRSQVFGEDWDTSPSSDFMTLRAQLSETDGSTSDQPADRNETSEPVALTINEAIENYSKADLRAEKVESDDEERFTSQLTFPTLLLQVLAVRKESAVETSLDRHLDDKKLVQRFSAELSSVDHSERREWVRTFTADLLLTRFLFDNYVLKRDSTLTTGVDSTTDEEPWSWSLAKLVRGESKSKGKRRSTPRYASTFAAAEVQQGPGTPQRRILLLQSALRITYTSPRTMHWITELLRYVTDCHRQNATVTASGVLDCLNKHALARLREAMLTDAHDKHAGTFHLPEGFAIPRIIFTMLDYLLVEEMNEWEFTFSYRTSIEHFSPVTEDVEHRSDRYHVTNRENLDKLGNLALVTVSANSKFSNYTPAQKAHNTAARKQSLKLELMARQAEEKGGQSWNDADIQEHHAHMVRLLERAVEELPSDSLDSRQRTLD